MQILFLYWKINIAITISLMYNGNRGKKDMTIRKIPEKIRDYFCYCGISKDEYNSLKKQAYISNFTLWQVLHVLMTIAFGLLFINALLSESLKQNLFFYLGLFCYSTLSTVLFFFVFKKKSIIAQLWIYLSIIALFIFSALIATKSPDQMAVTFMVLLVITPMFMLDKPYFMSITLILASIIFLIWMKNIKPDDIWFGDLVNAITFTGVGIFLHIISNSIRIREFVLRSKLEVQKDTDELTGLMNKAALTRNINEYLQKPSNKGIFFVLDVDDFKEINDKYGHDVGDDVLRQIGEYLGNKIGKNEIVGRFGGDEFIIMIKNNDDLALASKLSRELADDFKKYIKTPNAYDIVKITIGIAIYRGEESNYSEIFKKADTALYAAKAEGKNNFRIY